MRSTPGTQRQAQRKPVQITVQFLTREEQHMACLANSTNPALPILGRGRRPFLKVCHVIGQKQLLCVAIGLYVHSQAV